MELINETSLPAALFRGTLMDDARMLGFVVAKATYTVGPSGEVAPDATAPIPIAANVAERPPPALPPDNVPWKRGVDVFVLGRACAPHGKPARSVDVEVRVGASSRRAVVFGDRRWEGSGGAPTIGEPEPFVELPLDWEHAYGGMARVRGAEVPNAYNAAGAGYLLDRAEAPGTKLPNVEDPDARIRAWDDAPIPLAFGVVPLDSQFLAEDMLDVDRATGKAAFRRVSFNRAHPKLRLDAVRAADAVAISGMTPALPLAFRVPLRPLTALVWLEDRRYAFPL